MILTPSNYFSREANERYMSVSQFKSFASCPASALAEIRGEYLRETTPAMLVGSYVDAWVEGTTEQFMTEHPEIFKRDGTLKAEYVQAEAIIERIKRDALFMDYLKGDKQVIMTGTINGVEVKIKADVLAADRIVDLKIMKDFGSVYVPDKGREPWFIAWGYDIQGAVYQEIVRQNTGKKLPFYLAAATKEKMTDIDVIHIGQKHLDYALESFTADVTEYDAIKKGVMEADRCEKCEY
jgi:hypothetical protein